MKTKACYNLLTLLSLCSSTFDNKLDTDIETTEVRIKLSVVFSLVFSFNRFLL